ncbi:hypothetical protein [Arthrobacter sp. TMS1-12-1]
MVGIAVDLHEEALQEEVHTAGAVELHLRLGHHGRVDDSPLRLDDGP